jgi:hypothetical protein
MKKLLLILLAALLLLASACGTQDAASTQTPQDDAAATPTASEPTPPPPPEEATYEPLPEEYKPLSQRVQGEWYADMAGLPITLTLAEDGAYTLTTPGGESRTGVWEAKDGQVILDGDEDAPVLPLGEALRMEDLLFTRTRPTVYEPAEIYADAAEGSFDGYWVSRFSAAGEGTILSSAIGEDTELYIEGTRLAANGALLGTEEYDCSFDAGALSFTTDKGTVKLELLQDGFLRLTLDGDTPAVLYLMAMSLPGELDEAANP